MSKLVEFLHHGNTQIRQIGKNNFILQRSVFIFINLDIAAENLVGYSTSQPDIFKTGQLTPVKDLKLLVKDYPVWYCLTTPDLEIFDPNIICFSQAIAKNALTILINISADAEILKTLAEDDAFLESLLLRVTVCQFTKDRSNLTFLSPC